MPRIPAVLVAAGLGLAACTTVEAPVTGRDQLVLVSQEEADQLGRRTYEQIARSGKLSRDRRLNALVTGVGNDIVADNGGNPAGWTFFVIDDRSPNAFALPGGYVGIHTGMLNLARTRSELAVVLAHEIAHLQARHPSERLSRSLLTQTGLAAIGAIFGNPQAQQVAGVAADLALERPFSRTQEAEADTIGLEYMARAGYDPRAALTLWQRMSSQGGQPPEFLSSHPSHGNRMERLQAQMPRALAIYESVPHES